MSARPVHRQEANALVVGARWKSITADPILHMRLHSDNDKVIPNIRTILQTEPNLLQSISEVAFGKRRGDNEYIHSDCRVITYGNLV